jgi:hypothetical protein
MFTVKIGPTTTEVECALLEQTAVTVVQIEEKVDRIQTQLDHLLDVVGGTPHIEFTIGPVTEQE